jgi:hypothetical protein
MNELTEAELKATDPLMAKIEALRSDPGREVTGFQLIRLFVERRVQPVAFRLRRMWEYTGVEDPSRISREVLSEAEVDNRLRSVTALIRTPEVPRAFEKVPFFAEVARTEVGLNLT